MSGPIRANDVDQLATASRNGFVENRFFGSAVVVESIGVIIAGAGDPAAGGYARSALKPVRAIGSLQCGGGISGAQLAVVTRPSDRSPWHHHHDADAVAQVGLSTQDLQCTAVMPQSAAQVAAAALEMAPIPLERSRLAHNCSGKHAGFLAATVGAGADPADYLADNN